LTLRERILEHIRSHPEGLTDSQISHDIGIRHHPQVNSRCNGLKAEGLIERNVVNGRIHNLPVAGLGGVPPVPPQVAIDSAANDWFWEGNVQNAVVTYLEGQGYTIISCADCALRQRGRDIEAQSGAGSLWVTAKGYPSGTAKTHASTQAGHWFKQGLFDIIAWRGEDADARLAFALPDYPRYRKLAQKVAWLIPAARFSFIWVQQDGTCRSN